jgi:hypothetical protein
MIKIEKINFKGYANSWQVSNGEIELVITGDIGPRVMRFGFPGGQNFFKEFTDQMGRTGEATWQARGGHRVWIAPEDIVKSYAPDNERVDIDIQGNILVATAPVEAITGIEKRITIRMAAAGSGVEVIHELRNAGSEPYSWPSGRSPCWHRAARAFTAFPPRRHASRNAASPPTRW